MSVYEQAVEAVIATLEGLEPDLPADALRAEAENLIWRIVSLTAKASRR